MKFDQIIERDQLKLVLSIVILLSKLESVPNLKRFMDKDSWTGS